MTALLPAISQRPTRLGNRVLSRRFVFVLLLGGSIGTLVGLGLYVTKTAYVGLLPLGLLLVLPTLVLKNFRLYWFVIFLLSLQFEIAKNLNDGLAVMEDLKINYTLWDFTFEITATDLALLVLLLIWANDRLFLGKPIRFPPITWWAVGYLGLCVLSTVGAASPYLGFVELSRQIKFFVVYLYAVNCLDSKNAVRVLAVVAVLILAIQGGMTVTRFETGYMTPLTFGDTHQDLSQITEYLAVDRTDEGSAIRSFGTLGSPGSTVRLCMMIIPFALFLSVPNALFKMRFVFAALTVFGILSLLLTFTRVYYITTAFQIALAFSMMVRDRMLRREELVLILLLGVGALAAASPKLYQQFTVREDSVSVRFLQYEATAKMILDNPILGVGLNNGTGEKQKYSKVTYNEHDPDTQFDREPTHNMYLNLVSEIGIFGALSFFAFFTKVTLLAWRQSRETTDPEIRTVANALVVVFCGVAVNGLMDPLGEYPALMLLWLFAGLTFNLPAMARDDKSMNSSLGGRIR